MDIQEKRQLELAGHVARVRAEARPWRSIIALVLAVAAAATALWFGHFFHSLSAAGPTTDKVITLAAAAGFAVFGMIATLGLSGKARDRLRPVAGSAHAAVIRYTIVLLGSIAVIVITLDLLKIGVQQLVLGGAVTTILIGIAAQQALGNVFAGMVLLLSRPFGVGDQVGLRSGSLGGLIEGTVTEIGITYLCIETRDGPLRIPNSQVLAAAVGPSLPPPADDGKTPPP